MIFKKLAMEFALFSEETLSEVSEKLRISCKESSGPAGDLDLSIDQN
jgi:hypothetical protein